MPFRLIRRAALGILLAPAGAFALQDMSGATGLPSREITRGAWNLMYQGIAFGQFDSQGGARGGTQVGVLSWGMLMASRSVAGGQLQLRTMLSPDAAGVTTRGYPLLLQSGERLHDRQHPHDFWMELGASYEHAVHDEIGWRVYGAAAGEPALGPVAFTERPSAMDNPVAPLGHHWQDATHVTFGVTTFGVYGARWKLEGSAFNGREPDDHRYNFDFGRLDSYSARVTLTPSSQWAATAGYGFIKELEAGESVHRIVGSLLHSIALGDDGQVATALVFGANTRAGTSGLSKSVLVESEWVINARNTVFARVESVQKSAEDLQLTDPLAQFSATTLFNVRSASLGFVREIANVRAATIGLGAAGSVNFVPSPLEPSYGSRTPVGGVVFLRVRFRDAPMHGMPGM